MSQSQRDRAMEGFRTGRFDILVATDIVARGIDVSGVSHVINYDVPNTPEAYTHRIGRTGRSEQTGKACTFITADDKDWLRATERMIGAPIPQRALEGFEHVTLETATGGGGGGNGGRNGRGRSSGGGRRSSGGRSGGNRRSGARGNGGRSQGSGRSGSGGQRTSSRSGGESRGGRRPSQSSRV